MICPKCGIDYGESSYCLLCEDQIDSQIDVSDEELLTYIQELEGETANASGVFSDNDAWEIAALLTEQSIMNSDSVEKVDRKDAQNRDIFCPRCKSVKYRVDYESDAIRRRLLLNHNTMTRIADIAITLYEILHRKQQFVCRNCGHRWTK